MLYGINSLAEHGLEDGMRKYAYPGGERLVEMHYYWNDYDYDGAYKWPIGVSFTQEQTDEVNKYLSDLTTYISENYLGFLDNSKPLSEWDEYVAGLYQLGWAEVLAVYQEAYDAYIAEQSLA
jgi:putative aldouronate transport system substrate-binding protein